MSPQSSSLQLSVLTTDTAPRPPPRSPLRQKSTSSLKMVDSELSSFLREVEAFSKEVGKLSDQIYEIQELRHSSGPSLTVSTDAPASPLDQLLATFNRAVDSSVPKMQSLRDSSEMHLDDKEVREGMIDLNNDWASVLEAQAVLKEEMKEDGFLVRFRTAADQADSMMDTLKKSIEECLAYIEKIINSSIPVPMVSDYGISIQDFAQLATSHDSLKKSYMQSISKILKIMDKSISERPTKNGETLRRNGDMNQRWMSTLKSSQQLDAKIQLTLSQYYPPPPSHGDIEILRDHRPYHDPNDSPYAIKTHQTHRRDSASTGSSFSLSSVGLSSTPTIKRQPSNISNLSTNIARNVSTPDKPRWNPSVRPDLSSMNRHISSLSLGSKSSTPERTFSPTPSNGSTPRYNGKHPQTPSTIPRRSIPRNPPSSYRSQTPTLGNTFRPPSRTTDRPSSRQERPSSRLERPSSRIDRPSSRQSMAPTSSITPGSTTSRSTPQPFNPSKYDHLDQAVSRVIASSGYQGFVARLDQALQKSQRKGDGEWKGEFMFGGGERGVSVKLLEIRGRDGVKEKVMVRIGGAWQDLEGLLRSRGK